MSLSDSAEVNDKELTFMDPKRPDQKKYQSGFIDQNKTNLNSDIIDFEKIEARISQVCICSKCEKETFDNARFIIIAERNNNFDLVYCEECARTFGEGVTLVKLPTPPSSVRTSNLSAEPHSSSDFFFWQYSQVVAIFRYSTSVVSSTFFKVLRFHKRVFLKGY